MNVSAATVYRPVVSPPRPPAPHVVRASIIDPLAWICAIVGVAYHLLPLLASHIPAGNHLTAHYYLYTQAIEYLRNLHLSGYNPQLLGGYPEFSLTPLFAYLPPAALHLASMGMLSPELSFNVFVFFLPLLLVISSGTAAASFWGGRAGTHAVLITCLGMLYLAPPHFARVSLVELLQDGAYLQFLTLSLLLLFVGFLERIRRSYSFLATLAAGVLLGMLLTIDMAATCVALGVLLFWWCLGMGTRLAPTFLILALAGLLSVYTTIDIIKHLPYAAPLEPPAQRQLHEIFAAWFPDLATYQFGNLSKLGALRVEGSAITDKLVSVAVQIGDAFDGFPFLSIFLLGAAAVGLILQISKGRLELLGFLVAPLVLLPGELGYPIPYLPVRSYEVLYPIGALLPILASCTLFYLSRGRLLRFVLNASLLCALAYSLTMGANRNEHTTSGAPTGTAYYPFLNQYPDFSPAYQLVQHLRAKEGAIRVVDDRSHESRTALGTADFFTVLLPLQVRGTTSNTVEVLTAPSFERWRSRRQIENLIKAVQSDLQGAGTFVQQLRHYGVNYLIVANPALAQALRSLSPPLEEEGSWGRFLLFKLPPSLPPVFEAEFTPALFVEQGGLSFEQFNELWLQSPELFKTPVLYPALGLDRLKSVELPRLGVVILSAAMPGTELDSAIRRWRSNNKEVVVLLPGRAPESTQEGVRYIGQFGSASAASLQKLAEALSNNRIEYPIALPIAPSFSSTMRFESSKVVCLNYSYAPRMLLRGAGNNLFMSTPNATCFLGSGSERLSYQ